MTLSFLEEACKSALCHYFPCALNENHCANSWEKVQYEDDL